jgi:putative ABC transport system substrate-binding protein
VKRRRALVALAAVVAWPAAAQSTGKVWRVGYLILEPESLNPSYAVTLRQALRELGYVEGKNVVFEWRYAEGQPERLPELANELVRLKVDIIVAHASGAIAAAQKATNTIPIVMATTGDPVGSKFVQSLAHPGGNITGLSNMGGETGAKHVDLLITVVPKLKRLGLLVTPTSPTHRAIIEHVEGAATQSGIKTVVARASTPEQIDAAFALFVGQNVEAVIVGPAPFMNLHRERITRLALEHRLPSVSGSRGFVSAGGLMAYGQQFGYNYMRVASYIDQIFKGKKPGDLPVEQPLAFDLLVNQKTAKALGVTIPKDILLRAEVID